MDLIGMLTQYGLSAPTAALVVLLAPLCALWLLSVVLVGLAERQAPHSHCKPRGATRHKPGQP